MDAGCPFMVARLSNFSSFVWIVSGTPKRLTIIMNGMRRRRWAGSGAVACLVLTVVIVFPSESQAGCNHSWVLRTDPFGSWNDLARLESSDEEVHIGLGDPGKPERKSPCATGACSRSAELPAKAIDSGSFTVEAWGDLANSPRMWRGPSIRARQVADSPCSDWQSQPVDRPPRGFTSRRSEGPIGFAVQFLL